MDEELREKVARGLASWRYGENYPVTKIDVEEADAILAIFAEEREALDIDLKMEKQYREGVVEDLLNAEAREAKLREALLQAHGALSNVVSDETRLAVARNIDAAIAVKEEK